MVAVPSPLSLKVSPSGKAPDSLSAAIGLAWLLMVIENAVPARVDLDAGMFFRTGDWVMVSVKVWLACGRIPLAAVMMNAYAPTLAAVGPVLAMVAVPSPLSVKVMSAGRCPFSVRAGAG